MVNWGGYWDGGLYSPPKPLPIDWTNIVAISAGAEHDLFLRSDGTVLAWGFESAGECTVPPDLTNAIAVASGLNHSLALRADGTVIAWGENNWGQIEVPANLTGVNAISAGVNYNLALQSNGVVVSWGKNFDGQGTIPKALTNITAIFAAIDNSFALVQEPAQPNEFVKPLTANLSGTTFTVAVPTSTGSSYQLEFIDSLEAPSWRALPPVSGNSTGTTFGRPDRDKLPKILSD